MIDQVNKSSHSQKGAPNTFSTRFCLAEKLGSAMNSLGFWVMPGVCVMCDLASERHRDLCTYCEQDLPWLSNQCSECGLPGAVPTNESTTVFSVTDTKFFSGICNTNASSPAQSHSSALSRCSACKTTTHFSPITKTVAPLAYEGCARWLVQQQKHRRGSVHGRLLAELLGDAILAHYSLESTLALPDLLIPVPLHWRRHWARGHNQSTLLAQHLARRFDLTLSEAVVKRSSATLSQQSLSAARRATNIAGAFGATRSASRIIESLPNKRVAIVDDVVTTGATARALAETLRAAGAMEIHLWSPSRAILR